VPLFGAFTGSRMTDHKITDGKRARGEGTGSTDDNGGPPLKKSRQRGRPRTKTPVVVTAPVTRSSASGTSSNPTAATQMEVLKAELKAKDVELEKLRNERAAVSRPSSSRHIPFTYPFTNASFITHHLSLL
jgi:hypothetical protein